MYNLITHLTGLNNKRQKKTFSLCPKTSNNYLLLLKRTVMKKQKDKWFLLIGICDRPVLVLTSISSRLLSLPADAAVSNPSSWSSIWSDCRERKLKRRSRWTESWQRCILNFSYLREHNTMHHIKNQQVYASNLWRETRDKCLPVTVKDIMFAVCATSSSKSCKRNGRNICFRNTAMIQ